MNLVKKIPSLKTKDHWRDDVDFELLCNTLLREGVRTQYFFGK